MACASPSRKSPQNGTPANQECGDMFQTFCDKEALIVATQLLSSWNKLKATDERFLCVGIDDLCLKFCEYFSKYLFAAVSSETPVSNDNFQHAVQHKNLDKTCTPASNSPVSSAASKDALTKSVSNGSATAENSAVNDNSVFNGPKGLNNVECSENCMSPSGNECNRDSNVLDIREEMSKICASGSEEAAQVCEAGGDSDGSKSCSSEHLCVAVTSCENFGLPTSSTEGFQASSVFDSGEICVNLPPEKPDKLTSNLLPSTNASSTTPRSASADDILEAVINEGRNESPSPRVLPRPFFRKLSFRALRKRKGFFLKHQSDDAQSSSYWDKLPGKLLS